MLVRCVIGSPTLPTCADPERAIAVIAESYVVVVRKEVVDTRWPGGEAAFARAAPGGTYCCDGHLCTVCFMVLPDAQLWIQQLVQAGFEAPTTDVADELTLFDTRQGHHYPASWLCDAAIELQRHDQQGTAAVRILWLGGQLPSPLFAHGGYKVGATSWVSQEEMAEYVLVEEVAGVAKYVHPVTGDTRYVGRAGSTNSTRMQERIDNLEARVWRLADPPFGPLTDEQRRTLRDLLEEVRELDTAVGGNSRCTLIIGVGHRRLGEWVEASQAFRILTEQAPEFLGGWLDLVWSLSEQGKHADAEPIARQAVTLAPESPAALGNLAATLLALERFDECDEVLTRALELAPSDEVNQRIREQLTAKRAAAKPWWKRIF